MAKYKIHTLEVRTIASLGKKVAECELIEEGQEFPLEKKVSIWQDFPGFETITFGATVEGNIATNDKGYQSLKAIPKLPATGSFGGPRGIAKAQEVKGQQIKEAQERKSDSIAFFNATNSAIALVTKMTETQPVFPGEAEMKVKIRAWRDWFIQEYEDYNTKAPF